LAFWSVAAVARRSLLENDHAKVKEEGSFGEAGVMPARIESDSQPKEGKRRKAVLFTKKNQKTFERFGKCCPYWLH
jgi:hypothetical protein